MLSPNDFKTRFTLKDPNALADLQALLESRIQEKGYHLEWALLCESLGLANLAAREFQLECRDNPQGPHARFKVALLHREKGEVEKALAILEQLLTSQNWDIHWVKTSLEIFLEEGSNARASKLLEDARSRGITASELKKIGIANIPADIELQEGPPEISASDSDVTRFWSLFSGRENVYARQWSARDGEAGYSPVHEPLTPAVIRNHLMGSVTVGVYPIRLDGTCTFFALDLDISKSAIEKATGKTDASRALRNLVRQTGILLFDKLLEQGLTPLLEDSGYKGRHIWFFLEQPETAENLHKLGTLLQSWLSCFLPEGLHLEYFPKQGSLKGKGLGNLIKLPLGIHRRTGRRALLLDPAGVPIQRPFDALRVTKKVTRAALLGLFDFLKSRVDTPGQKANTKDTSDSFTQPVSTTQSISKPPSIPSWTEDDFILEPRISHLLSKCPVLMALKEKVDTQRSLTHEEQLVLIHTLGHLDAGPLAVNFLLRKCIDVASGKPMGDKLKGSPTACSNIRKRIPHITRHVNCNCSFEDLPGRYPTPELHLLSLPLIKGAAPSVESADLPALAARYLEVAKELSRINHEHSILSARIIPILQGLPGSKIEMPGGTLSAKENPAGPQLHYLPRQEG